MKKTIYICCLSLFAATLLTAQNLGKQVSANAYSRATFFLDDFNTLGDISDTVTPRKINSGHVLADLGINIKPNPQTEIIGMVRVRNDFGGFWGSGVTFDVRQLSLKGVVGGIVRYQLGDFNYKLTPYTFYNNTEELAENEPEFFKVYRDMVHQDLFYDEDNSWRQQGASLDFGLEFKKVIDEMNFNFFTSRIRPSNFGSINDQIFAGTSIGIVQSKKLSLAFNYVKLLDLEGTAANDRLLSNPVFSVSAAARIWSNSKFTLSFKGEVGASKYEYANDTLAPELEDYFMDLDFALKSKKTGLVLNVNYINVGADFRSPGAQTKRVLFNSRANAYTRYDNAQYLRTLGMMDLMRDASLYNTRISSSLMAYNPSYGNTSPYGNATPNRTGLKIGLKHLDLKNRWELHLNLNNLSEITGSGTDEIRKFNTLKASTKIHLNALMPVFKEKLDLNIAYWSENTSRTEESDFETVDLANQSINIGLEAGLGNNFELLGGFRSLTSSGFDFIPETNIYNEIIDFNEYRTELSEIIYGLGIRYNFSEKVNISLLYHNYSWKDEQTTNAEYELNQFSINYIMHF